MHSTTDLFAPAFQPRVSPDNSLRPKNWLNQYFLAPFAGELLWQRHMSHLRRGACVWDIGSGCGNTLAAVPAHIDAFGTEIDPNLARTCRRRTGRTVLCGDFNTVRLPRAISAAWGNPPWVLPDIDRLILERLKDELPSGAKSLFVIGGYVHDSVERVLTWSKYFTLEIRVLPRSLFPGLEESVVSLIFTRSRRPRLINFDLYEEVYDLRRFKKPMRSLLCAVVDSPGSVWRRVFDAALRSLGGEASLDAIYDCVSTARPSANRWWKEQLRKIAQDSRRYVRIARGRYAFAPAGVACMA